MRYFIITSLLSISAFGTDIANRSDLYMNKAHYIGIGVSKYKYGEYADYIETKVDGGGHIMTIGGTNISADYSYVHPILTRSFLKFDGRLAYGVSSNIMALVVTTLEAM